jgi:hypothetical protein
MLNCKTMYDSLHYSVKSFEWYHMVIYEMLPVWSCSIIYENTCYIIQPSCVSHGHCCSKLCYIGACRIGKLCYIVRLVFTRTRLAWRGWQGCRRLSKLSSFLRRNWCWSGMQAASDIIDVDQLLLMPRNYPLKFGQHLAMAYLTLRSKAFLTMCLVATFLCWVLCSVCFAYMTGCKGGRSQCPEPSTWSGAGYVSPTCSAAVRRQWCLGRCL